MPRPWLNHPSCRIGAPTSPRAKKGTGGWANSRFFADCQDYCAASMRWMDWVDARLQADRPLQSPTATQANGPSSCVEPHTCRFWWRSQVPKSPIIVSHHLVSAGTPKARGSAADTLSLDGGQRAHSAIGDRGGCSPRCAAVGKGSARRQGPVSEALGSHPRQARQNQSADP